MTEALTAPIFEALIEPVIEEAARIGRLVTLIEPTIAEAAKEVRLLA